MPVNVKKGEREEDFISRCIAEEINSGREQSQAAAICYSYWRKDKMSKIVDPTAKVMAKVAYDTDFRGINLFADLEKGPNDPCYENYVQIGTKDLDGKQVPNCVPLKEEMTNIEADKGMNLADYPWDECIADQTERYGDEETAKKVCGYIKSISQGGGE